MVKQIEHNPYRALSLSSPLPSICGRPEKRRGEEDTGRGQVRKATVVYVISHNITAGRNLTNIDLDYSLL